MEGWISVEDKLPNIGEWVLAYSLCVECCLSACNVAYLHEDGWCDGDFDISPSYWMPLPPNPSL